MKKTMKVTGIHCRNCATYLEKALKDVPGVTSATVDFASETATIECDDSVSNDTLMAAAVATGKDIVSIE